MTPSRDGPAGRLKLSTILRAASDLGPASLAWYAAYRISMASGLARLRTPERRWSERPAQAWLNKGVPTDPQGYSDYRRDHPRPFLFEPDEDLAPRLSAVVEHTRGVLSEADAILEGEFPLFGLRGVRLGFPPDWAAAVDLEPSEARARVDLQPHWTEAERQLGQVDVKLVWEVSRFGWAFALVRAARLSGDRRYAEGFWSLLQSWKEANQPNCGVNWSSGQEVALRLMAVVFARYGLAPFWSDAPERFLGLAEFIAAHAARIPPTMVYARAQGNNHLIAEAAALYTTGLLFPELRESGRWRRIGRSELVRALRRQISDDGGYIQHSVNYHRLALEVFLWAARLGSLHNDPFPDDCAEKLARSAACLEALVDPQTGEAPNFGPNDGAHFLPLSCQPHGDFRPVVQAASMAFRGRPAYPRGPWDELGLWLALAKEQEKSSDSSPPLGESFPQAGLHFLRGERTKAMIRCVRFTSRPGHADQLHFDLWRDGRNVARDPGTYRYQASPPWDNTLSQARVHNSVTVGGVEPMERAGRFLWLEWDQGRSLGRWRTPNGDLEVFAAEREGYRGLGLSHVRTVVRVGDDLWLVVDDLTRWPDTGRGEAALPPTALATWNLPDWLFVLDGRLLTLEIPGEAHPLRVESSAGQPGLYRAGQLVGGKDVKSGLEAWGWWSGTYGQKEPSLFFAVEVGGGLPLRLSTWWCFGAADPAALKIGWADPKPAGKSIAWLSHHGARLDL
jgi:hypothetical protein